MSKHQTATHQNLSVWARRFQVEFNDMDKAAEAADKFYGVSSRRAVLQVCAIKALAEATDKPSTDPGVWFAGLAGGDTLYKAVYGEESINVHVEIRNYLNDILAKGIIDVTDRVAAGMLENKVANLAMDALNARNQEHSTPSMANMILAKARNPKQ